MALHFENPANRLPGLLLLALACASSAPPATAPPQTAAVKKYIVMIEGRNLLFESDGQPRRFGFSATRDVEASSPEEAEQRAIQSVHDDTELNQALLNDPSDPPRIIVTQNVEVESFESHRRPSLDYIFYADRDTR